MKDIEDDRTSPSTNMLERARKVSLASVLLRLLEVLAEKDADQRYLDLLNELKPRVERRLRDREGGGVGSRLPRA